MKKLFVIVAMAALASCGGSDSAATADTTAAPAMDTAAPAMDSAAAVDTTAVVAPAAAEAPAK